MFQQTADGLPVFAICCASATESFYRSALNAMINAKLTGKMGGLFPNMHVQLPMRVSYILGFKTVRYLLDEKVDRSKMGDMQNLGLACVPGLAMTPFSSMLEACNAGHLNPEPLWRRWTRGIAWRSAREVIFGIGGRPACACRVILWAARWRQPNRRCVRQGSIRCRTSRPSGYRPVSSARVARRRARWPAAWSRAWLRVIFRTSRTIFRR